MRRALILCLLFVACQNETNERLARVEKKLDEVKQRTDQAAQQIPNPSLFEQPKPPAPAPVAPSPVPMTKSEADAFVNAGTAQYVSTKMELQLGLVRSVGTNTLLYKWWPSISEYGPEQWVSIPSGPNGQISLNEAQMEEMRAALTR